MLQGKVINSRVQLLHSRDNNFHLYPPPSSYTISLFLLYMFVGLAWDLGE